MLCGNRSSSMSDQPCVWWRSPSSMVCSRSSPSDSRGTTQTALCFVCIKSWTEELSPPNSDAQPIIVMLFSCPLLNFTFQDESLFFSVCVNWFMCLDSSRALVVLDFTIWNTNYPQLGYISSIAQWLLLETHGVSANIS